VREHTFFVFVQNQEKPRMIHAVPAWFFKLLYATF